MTIKPLSALAIGALPDGVHAVGGIPGLSVKVRGSGRTFVLRYVDAAGRRRETSLTATRLAEARDEAAATRSRIRQGLTPRPAPAAPGPAGKTFADAVDACLAVKLADLKSDKHKAQWRMTLARYGAALSSMPVGAVDTDAVLAVLSPLWETKNETAGRLRGRIETVLNYAAARGWRTGENPARWKGHLDQLLRAPSDVQPERHHPAIAWREIPHLWQRLMALPTAASLGLRWMILTACRYNEVAGATHAEVDGDTWTVPAERMKAGREHRVPLPPAALALIRSPAPGLLFPGQRRGRPLSNGAFASVLRELGYGSTLPHITPHGMRSAFRVWAAEATDYGSDLAEFALAHVITDKVVAAYQRSDLLERRRPMMAAWADFVSGD